MANAINGVNHAAPATAQATQAQAAPQAAVSPKASQPASDGEIRGSAGYGADQRGGAISFAGSEGDANANGPGDDHGDRQAARLLAKETATKKA